jgi:hypothetical protein
VAATNADPLACLSLRERRRWRRADRRAVADYEAHVLGTLRWLAATGASVVDVTIDASSAAGSDPCAGPLELVVTARPPSQATGLTPGAVRDRPESGSGLDERRIRIGRVARSALAPILTEWPRSEVALVGAGRYGSYWVLAFEVTGVPLIVLAGGLRLVPTGGIGATQREGLSRPPAASLAP